MTNKTTQSIAFIGAGNMASSLMIGLVADGYPPASLIATNIDNAKLEHLKQQAPIQTTTDNAQAVKLADIIVLCVKPAMLPQVCTEIAPIVKTRQPLILSIAAGITTDKLTTWLGQGLPIVRCMPNTPALVRCGASGLFANSETTQQHREIAESILRAVGITLWLDDETQLDIVTALSGSGPAYFFLIIEALQDIAVTCGLTTEAAKLLTIQTALGAARIALEAGKEVKTLRQQVTSPGGTTEAALQVLETANIRDIFAKAVKAAIHKSQQLNQTT